MDCAQPRSHPHPMLKAGQGGRQVNTGLLSEPAPEQGSLWLPALLRSGLEQMGTHPLGSWEMR